MEKRDSLLMLLGAIRTARHALAAADGPIAYGDRIDQIDEELRKLARDIAREAGV